MKYIILIVAFFSSLAAAQSHELPLMPYPQQVTQEQGQLRLPQTLVFSVEGFDLSKLLFALDNFDTRITLQTGIDIKLKVDDAEHSGFLNIALGNQQLNKNPAKKFTSLDDIDESYHLNITKKSINLTAQSYEGVLHGLETLLQLIGEQKKTIKLPLVDIKDYPRFKWRGLLLDTSRHFFSVATIKRQLDLMAAAKLNIFHWHLTDDQGWRIELQSFPKLHQLASDGEYYTQQDIREVVAYAKERGIHVLPEIDMPGHASAIAVAYPALLSGPGPYTVETRWGVHSPTLNPANEDVYIFADKVFAELTSLFPFEYIHIGGDEVHPDEWNKSPSIQQFMRDKKLSSPQDLQAYFNQRLVSILEKHQRKMIGWDEIQHPQLPKDIVVQSWRGPDAVSDAVSHGFRALLSTGYYLDQAQPAVYHYRNDPIPSAPMETYSLAENETAKSWSFSFARKRGAPVTGSFTFIYSDNKVQRGFIDFKDKSRREIYNIKSRENLTQFSVASLTQFSVDSWMGVVTFSIPTQATSFSNHVLVANATYELHAQALTEIPKAVIAPQLSAAQQALILGGEAALWAEIVDESVIDLRLWPRAFVVAERLWSAADKRDEDSMYKRMSQIENTAIKSVNLQSKYQSEALFKKLVGGDNTKPLEILAQAVEQAQYYHRQHEKMVHASYSKKDPLDQFVDALPAENFYTRELDQLVSIWLASPNNTNTQKKILAIFSSWQANSPNLKKLINANAHLKTLAPTATRVEAIANLGSLLVNRIGSKKALTPEEVSQAQQTLSAAKTLENEMIISAAYPVEKLLDAAQQSILVTANAD